MTFTLTEHEFWRLVNALEDSAFKSLYSAKEMRNTGYHGASEAAEKRIQHAHELLNLANDLKVQARED